MLIDAATAKALSAVIIISTQGADILNPQLPFEVVDRGDMWLVKGTPYTDKQRGLQFCMCHIFIRKNSAEVAGIGCDGRMILTEQEKSHWGKFMAKPDYDRVFGPSTEFSPSGIEDIVFALYGGLINKPADAVEYAHVLLQTKPSLATIPAGALEARQENKVWHVMARKPGHADGAEVLSFSRRNGKVLSGEL